MPKFIVSRKEVHTQAIEVEADTPEEARDKVAEGECEDYIGESEYLGTLDPDTWNIYLDDNIVKCKVGFDGGIQPSISIPYA